MLSHLPYKVFSTVQGLFPNRELTSLKFVVGVSGGADSMALLHVFNELKIPVIVAHINYKQRAMESDAEEQLVADYCRTHALPFYSKSWELGTSVPSFQEKARVFRYQFFESILTSEKCDGILTAHHEKDRIESFLYNLARGAGLDGVNSLARSSGNIVRPFFDVNKDEIVEYIEANKVSYRDDKSNFESKYTRNFIRLEILPELEKIHPSATGNIIGFLNRTSSAVDELHALYEKVIGQIQHSYTHQSLAVIELDLSTLTERVKDVNAFFVHVLRRLNVEFHRKDIALFTELAQKYHSESKTLVLGNYTFEFFQAKLYIVSGNRVKGAVIIKNLEDLIALISVSRKVKIVDAAVQTFEKGKLYLAIDKLKFPLRLENTADGDKIKPFGMKGKAKKVSDLLTEASYPQWRKQCSEVLFDVDNQLIVCDWIRHSESVAYHDLCEKTIIIN